LSKLVTDAALAPAIETLLYPPPFGLSLAASADQHGLSHAVLLGLVRQESAFDVRIDSRVGARGLMQLMPAVGARLAARVEFHPDDLYRPEVNLELGCRLLADELRAASGHLPQALAAYNAGADRAAQWSERLHSHEPEELYLDLAEFYETRDYLKNVLGNVEMYRRLYALP
jgi:soluble lytic murein transglycosylase